MKESPRETVVPDMASRQQAPSTLQPYCEILPRLSEFTVKKIRVAIDVSHPYATLIRRGKKFPRHWLSLAQLLKLDPETEPRIKNRY